MIMGREIVNVKSTSSSPARPYVGRSRSSFDHSKQRQAIRASPAQKTTTSTAALTRYHRINTNNNGIIINNNDNNIKRSKSNSRSMKTTISKWWNAPETKRKTRLAQYNLYSVEGKMKYSFKKSFRWIKRTCSRIVHGLS